MYLSKECDPKRLRTFATFISLGFYLGNESCFCRFWLVPSSSQSDADLFVPSHDVTAPFLSSASRNFNVRGDACAVKAVSRSLFTTSEVGLSELFSALVRDLGGISDTSVFISPQRHWKHRWVLWFFIFWPHYFLKETDISLFVIILTKEVHHQ